MDNFNIEQEATVLVKFLRFLYQFFAAAVWVYEKIVLPVTKPFRSALYWAYLKYRALWDRTVYLKTGHFSKTRAGLLLATTIAAFYILPVVAVFLGHTALYFATVEEETVYLTYSQEIYPDKDIHAVRGCEELPCTDQDTISFRVEPSDFNHLWNILHHASLFYPDYVAGAVPPGTNKCTILTYGFRGKFLLGKTFLMRNFDVYPDILRITCDKVT